MQCVKSNSYVPKVGDRVWVRLTRPEGHTWPATIYWIGRSAKGWGDQVRFKLDRGEEVGRDAFYAGRAFWPMTVLDLMVESI